MSKTCKSGVLHMWVCCVCLVGGSRRKRRRGQWEKVEVAHVLMQAVCVWGGRGGLCRRCASSLSVGRRGRMSGMKGVMCPMGLFGCGVWLPG